MGDKRSKKLAGKRAGELAQFNQFASTVGQGLYDTAASFNLPEMLQGARASGGGVNSDFYGKKTEPTQVEINQLSELKNITAAVKSVAEKTPQVLDF